MTTTLVVSTDLMDRSKIAAALADAVFVRDVASALAHGADTGLVVVDLRLVAPDDLAGLVDHAERVVAFGSHVDDDTLAAARSAGAEALPRSVFFRRLADRAL